MNKPKVQIVSGRKLSRIACQMADRYLVTYTTKQLYRVTVMTKPIKMFYSFVM